MKKRKLSSEQAVGLIACPICGKQVPFAVINAHMDSSCKPARRWPETAVNGLDSSNTAPRIRHLEAETSKQTKPSQNLSQPIEEIPEASQNILRGSSDANSSLKLKGHEKNSSDERESNGLLKTETEIEHETPMNSANPHALSVLMNSAAQKLPGHHLFEKFISEEEEKTLIDFIETCDPPWHKSTFNGGHSGKRWGVLMDLQKRTVSKPTHEMPEMFMKLAERMRLLPPLSDFFPTEANANSYVPEKGDHLGPHVDDRQLSTGAIVTLSLMSSSVMTFKKEKQSLGSAQVRIHLPAGSLSVLTKEARYSFTHEIAKADFHGTRRISVTFRQSALKS